jgi:hypothetical protein
VASQVPITPGPGLVLFAVLSGYGWLLWRTHQMGARQSASGGERWWYSSSVDLVNLAGMVTATLTQRWLGLPGPQALLGAFASCLCVYGAEHLVTRRGLQGGWKLAVLGLTALVASLPAVLAPGPLTRGMRGLERALYGG